MADAGRPTEYTSITYIYRLCCPVSKKPVYVGKSNNPTLRLQQHISDAKRRHSRLHIWLRGLTCAPIIQVVMAVPESNWEEMEKRVIAAHRKNHAILNVADGGNAPKIDGVEYNKKLHELKKRMSQDLRRGYVREETKVKLRLMAEKMPNLFGEYSRI